MERECNKCVHRKEHGCEKWDCEFEPCTPTKEEALAILNTYDMSDDNEDMEFKSALASAIKALKKEPCEDAVSRQAVIKLAKGWWGKGVLAIDDIYELPLVGPTRKKGKWIYDKTIQNWRCSECNGTPKTLGFIGTADFMAEHFKFCNHCGTEMVIKEEMESE